MVEAEMKYLDRKAAEIMAKVRATMLPLLPETLTVSEVTDCIYGDYKHDRGAMIFVTRIKPGYLDDRQRFLPDMPEESGEDSIADVRVEIPSAEGYGEDGGWGLGFGCTLGSGRMGPGSILYNYTGDVWTVDRDEIKRRLEILDFEAEEYAEDVVEFLCEELGLERSEEED